MMCVCVSPARHCEQGESIARIQHKHEGDKEAAASQELYQHDPLCQLLCAAEPEKVSQRRLARVREPERVSKSA